MTLLQSLEQLVLRGFYRWGLPGLQKSLKPTSVRLASFGLRWVSFVFPLATLGVRQLPIRSILDVGANRGQFAQRITAVFPQAQIYCFEPLPAAFAELERWAKSRPQQARALSVALGERAGSLEMHWHLNHDGSSSFLQTTTLSETLYPMTERQERLAVPMSTLDQAVAELPPLEKEILIKLDVQGYEDRVIRGGRETFRQAKVCIAEINLDVLYDEQASFKDIFVLLDELGYRYAGSLKQRYARDGHVIWLDAVFIK